MTPNALRIIKNVDKKNHKCNFLCITACKNVNRSSDYLSLLFQCIIYSICPLKLVSFTRTITKINSQLLMIHRGFEGLSHLIGENFSHYLLDLCVEARNEEGTQKKKTRFGIKNKYEL